MKPFACAHATHPQWRMAAGLVIAQLKAQMALPERSSRASLGILYFTDHYAHDANDLMAVLRQELADVSDWVGTVGVGIAADNVEYFDEPALAVMLCDVPREQYRVFSGLAPLASSPSFQPHSALVHADSRTPDLSGLLGELGMRTSSGYLFGGLAASRHAAPQVAWQMGAKEAGSAAVLDGGLSGVAFSESVAIISRVTQGCQPLRLPSGKAAQPHRITKSDQHVVLELDGQPALDVLLQDLGITLDDPQRAVMSLRQTFVGLTDRQQELSLARSQGRFGAETRVRHLVGFDPLRRGIAIADWAEQGSELTFCERNKEAARRDLMRICAEIREELSPEESYFEAENAINSIAPHADPIGSNGLFSSKIITGAIYVSCAGRGGPHFGGDSAELQILRHALGEVPLVGFFAGGEIAHQNLYGYTGVLTVFTAPA
jgi:small ligand-binding sensory domain FIST